MPNSSNIARKLLAAGFLAAAVVAAPAATLVYPMSMAHAEGGGIPDPVPGPELQPAPEITPMEPVTGQDVENAPRTTQDETTSINTGIGADQVPNINGDPCTGYWQSVVCSESEQNNVPVQPHTSISSSP